MNRALFPIVFFALLVAGCGSTGPAKVAAASPTPTASSTPSDAAPVHASPSASPATVVATPTVVSSSPAPAAGQAIRQWAKSATATTSYSPYPDTAWNASQATGAPNTAGCSDDGKAWASLSAGTIDTLTLTYSDRVIPSSLRIVQSYNPGRVSKVTVSGGGQSATIYTDKANSAPGGACVTLEILISGVTFAVDTAAVTVDQTGLGSWAEIDAVELLGTKA